MERAEESMQRMMEMQKQGADIYFGGFSQMKRFPFFSSVSNWFVPFSKQNPDMEEALDKLGDTKLVDTMLGAGPFAVQINTRLALHSRWFTTSCPPMCVR